jgi:hypothetical protein
MGTAIRGRHLCAVPSRNRPDRPDDAIAGAGGVARVIDGQADGFTGAGAAGSDSQVPGPARLAHSGGIGRAEIVT